VAAKARAPATMVFLGVLGPQARSHRLMGLEDARPAHSCLQSDVVGIIGGCIELVASEIARSRGFTKLRAFRRRRPGGLSVTSSPAC
jgi:hypothetical protein